MPAARFDDNAVAGFYARPGGLRLARGTRPVGRRTWPGLPPRLRPTPAGRLHRSAVPPVQRARSRGAAL